jgi:hypothetical protein
MQVCGNSTRFLTRPIQTYSARYPLHDLADGIQVSVEMMVGQPVKITVLVMDLDLVAVPAMDTFCMAGKSSFFGLPCGFFFGEIPLVIKESQAPHMLIAPIEWKMRHQVVAADKTIIGPMVEMAKKTIAYPW